MGESRTVGAPRELVLASAGAGKTYRLSSRIIQLLDAGAAPEEVFASTFTRKAAGEILDRVLRRLADGALEGTEDTDLGLSPERSLELLLHLVHRLHAVNVGTLDALFQRIVRAFTLDLGLPPGWSVSDGSAEARLRSEAVSRLLRDADRGAVVELLRLLQGGEARRGVHDLLLDQVGGLHGLYRELDPAVEDPWGFPPDQREWGGPVEAAELEGVARAVAEAEVPRRASDGAEDRRWVQARERAAELLLQGDLEAFASAGLGAKVLSGEGTYYGTPVPESLAAALEQGLELARRVVGAELQRRAGALGRLLPLYDGWIRRLRDAEGLYQFDDVTRLLAGSGTGGRGRELHYRLDARIRHVLLDEFQDTSLAQWWALRPILEEILSGYEGERGVVVVADPKQSIYGWRGGEPRILEAIRRDFTIPEDTLHRSWRSAPAVLDFVNRVFGGLRGMEEVDEEARPTVAAWLENFTPHEAARDELPGYVRVEVGPGGDDARKMLRPRLLAHAAARVAEIRSACPRATIGVLARSNQAVARLMGELRRLEVDASEESGVPVSDSPAVLSLLALLRMADHPADSAARYQVAQTPVAELVEAFDWRSEAAADKVAAAVRRRLAREGYGPVVAGWVRRMAPRAAPRDRRRLHQLAELAFRWDERATLRPTDFARWVREERVEDPGASRIRVMTVHQAKGLEFDVVVLPDLDQPLGSRGGEAVHPFRPEPDARITRVFPGVNKALAPLFPSLAPAVAQSREAAFRDGLSALYVALTRARFHLHVVLRPDPASGPSSSFSGGRVVREAVGASGRIGEGELLFQDGDSRWWEAEGAPRRFQVAQPDAEAPPPAPRETAPGPLLGSRPPGGRTRLLPRRSPSELEGGGKVRLEFLLRDRGGSARARGTVVHEWLSRVRWIEDGLPPVEELRRVAAEAAPGLSDPDLLLGELERWLQAPEIRSALSMASYPEGSVVHRERPFLRRDGEVLVHGVVDRLVVGTDPDGLDGRAWVLDFKTDLVGEAEGAPGERELERRTEHYRPQMEAYRRAVAREEGLRSERVEATLLFLRAGRAVRL